jgi:hypothetical protein
MDLVTRDEDPVLREPTCVTRDTFFVALHRTLVPPELGFVASHPGRVARQ